MSGSWWAKPSMITGSMPSMLALGPGVRGQVAGFRDRWWEGWIANGWRNKAKKPVANRDLWEPLIEAVQADPRRIRWEWVKGHSGDVMNDLVDRLAVDAARLQQGRSGVGRPEVLGPPDVARAREAPVTDDSGAP